MRIHFALRALRLGHAILRTLARSGSHLLLITPNGEAGERQAEKLIVRGMRSLKISNADLEKTKKSDSRKRTLAWLVRSRTTASASWIARRLQMGDPSNVSRSVRMVQSKKDKEIRKCKKTTVTVNAKGTLCRNQGLTLVTGTDPGQSTSRRPPTAGTPTVLDRRVPFPLDNYFYPPHTASKASSRTSSPSRSWASSMQSGGHNFTVPPPEPTGPNSIKPCSTACLTISQAVS